MRPEGGNARDPVGAFVSSSDRSEGQVSAIESCNGWGKGGNPKKELLRSLWVNPSVWTDLDSTAERRLGEQLEDPQLWLDPGFRMHEKAASAANGFLPAAAPRQKLRRCVLAISVLTSLQKKCFGGTASEPKGGASGVGGACTVEAWIRLRAEDLQRCVVVANFEIGQAFGGELQGEELAEESRHSWETPSLLRSFENLEIQSTHGETLGAGEGHDRATVPGSWPRPDSGSPIWSKRPDEVDVEMSQRLKVNAEPSRAMIDGILGSDRYNSSLTQIDQPNYV
ncbi:hypothetical protein AK812_SmicGene31598 [Symbiodinium microadriaticum]|uniref:Uncharacterized protein n=1 Tax=Symbiodinium microadriaticum TaxID=2951 RepID=A0A1Q9CWC2_SYMMI|nr:hypothetical protein AK812_SmicGene31598 [Symbiodinium microadriaticum]